MAKKALMVQSGELQDIYLERTPKAKEVQS